MNQIATRYERVVLDLEDRFSGPVLRAAAAAQVLDKSLNDVSGDSVKTQRSVDRTTTSVSRTGAESEKASRSIDKYSGRLGLLVDVATSLGPALVPIGAVGVPAFTGLASQMGFAALAAGTLVGSMQGIGDAVKKLEAARIAPTDASIEAARVAMSQLSDDGQKFALTLQGFLPVLRQVRDAGGEGWFPGLTDALESLEKLGPKAADIFKAIGKAGGDLAAEGAASLTTERWQPFFDFIETEAPRAMEDLAHTAGDLTHGLAELWMAFTPVINDFSSWMVDAANAFDEWATGLSQTAGFQEFVDYIRTNGPLVGDALGSIANAILQIVEAAAPLGGPTLRILASVADAIASLADSDLGTPLVAIASLSSAMRLLGRATDSLSPKFTKAGASLGVFVADMKAASSFGYMTRTEMERSAVATGRLSEQFRGFGKNALLLGGVGLAASGVSDKLGFTNTVTLGLAGSMAGPLGAALGSTIGLAMDLGDRFDNISAGATDYKDLITQVNAATLEQARAGQVNTDQLIKQAEAALMLARALGDGDQEKAAQAALDHAHAIDETVSSERDLAAAQDGTRRLFELQTQAINENIAAMRSRRAEALRGVNAELDYKGSILDAQDALKTNGKTVNENTRAGQANLRALYALASSWNAQDDATKNASGSLQKARANFIKTAEAMGMGEDKAKRLAKALFEIPSDRTTRINIETDLAAAKIRGLQSQLNTIDRDIYINVHARTPNLGGFGAQIGYAGGGYTGRGGKYEPAGVVHRREFVFSSEATDGNEAFLANLHRSLRGYADGGYVGPVPARAQSAMSTSRHTERIVERLPRTIVLRSDALGDVVIDTVDDRIYAHARREEEQAGL